MCDPSGQTLQKSVALAPSRGWEEIEIECWEWSGHWGGKNDGVVHGPPTTIAFLAENTGQKVGSLLLDDIRLVEGKPQPPVWNYVAARFEPSEGWHSSGDGQGAKGTLNGKTWRYDFTKGEAVHLTPRDNSLPGTPKQLRIRVKGDASGHTARLRIATHFMTFEKNIGGPKPVAGEAGVQEFVTAAPPGEGWRWYGGENDGRLHGPLRITRLSLDCNGKRDLGEFRTQHGHRHARLPTQASLSRLRGDDAVAERLARWQGPGSRSRAYSRMSLHLPAAVAWWRCGASVATERFRCRATNRRR